MPYYRWTAIDLLGELQSGRTFMRTYAALDQQLFAEEKALLSVHEYRPWGVKRADLRVRADICHQVAVLLGAGMHLAQALETVAQLEFGFSVTQALRDCAEAVSEGMPLHESIAAHNVVFDDLMPHVIAAGEESGALATCLETLSEHYAMQYDLLKKLRSALVVPLITLFFFVLVFTGTFVLVLPRFEQFFTLLHQQPPALTQVLFTLSAWMRSVYFLCAIGIVVCGILAVYRVLSRGEKKGRMHVFLLKMPLVGPLISSYATLFFTQTVAVLLEGGVRLSQALVIACDGIAVRTLRVIFLEGARAVETGAPLSSAFEGKKQFIELCALMRIGEAAGTLTGMMRKAAQLYQEKTYRLLTLLTSLVPPLLLILIGLFVGFLIFAVYLPLLSLSQVMG